MAESTRPPSAPPPRPPPSPQPLSITERQMLVEDNQVLVSVYVNALWGALCIFGFVVLRGWVRGPGGVFQRRQELQDLFLRPPRLVLGTIRQIWNWVMPLLAVSDCDIVACSGFDGLILTRVLLIGLQLFTVMTIFGMVVMIPVYYTRGGVSESSASLGTMAQLSVANIPTGSYVFLLPFFMTYVFIGYGCWVLLINCKCYAQLRMAYFTCLDALPPELHPEVPAAAAAVANAADDVSAAAGRAASAPAAVNAPAVAVAEVDDSSVTNRGGATIELPTMRGGSERDAAAAAAAAAVAARPAAAPQAPSAGGTAGPVAEGVEGGAADAAASGARTAQVMDVKSIWLNVANFFNPTLRMMLDYLDWQGPLNRTAARFGVRGLVLPGLAEDEAPRYARLYGEDDPLLQYDNLVMAVEAGEEIQGLVAPATAVPPRPPPAGGEAAFGGGGGEDGSRSSSSSGEGRGAVAGGAGGGSGVTVLPYWRPLMALGMMRRARPPTAAATIGGKAAPEAAAVEAAAPPPLVQPSGSSSARLRKGATAGLDVAASGPAGGAATRESAAAAGGGGARAIFPHLRYSLRHANASRRLGGQAQTLTAALTSSLYGMNDPRQPLLPGKRNVRLLQLLQVPMRTTGTAGAAGAAGAGAARATVRCKTMRPAGGAAATDDAGDEDDDPVRLVNASHYVVLIKRVHLKHGPSVIDRLAAATYIAVSRLRAAAIWAAGASAGTVEQAAGVASGISAATDALSYVSYGKRGSRTAAAASTTSSAAASATAAAGGESPSGWPPPRRRLARLPTMARSPRDVEAAAVAAAAAAAAAPLRGAAKVTHEVSRFFEMFEDPDSRLYDPLSDVCATDTRGGGKSVEAASLVARGASAPAAAAESAAAEAQRAAEADVHEDPNGAAVAAVLRDLFPKSFLGLTPVTNHDPVDRLIYKWDAKMLKLAAVVRDIEIREVRQEQRRRHRHGGGADVDVEAAAAGGKGAEAGAAGGCCGGGDKGERAAAAAEAEVKRLRARAAKLQADVRELESRITAARERVLRQPVGTAYFALFSNSQDAQMLAQCRRVSPPQGPGSLLSFDVAPAPAPDDVSWPGLWSTGSLELMLRRLAIVVPMAAIFALPIGPLQGALSSLDVSLCGGATNFEGIQMNELYVEWFCKPKNLAIKLWKSLLTGVLPSLVGLIWTALIMPHLLFLCSSISRREVSLSGQERQMQNWFFWYSLINTFLGAVLGGGMLSQLGTYLANPAKVLDKIGRALPTTANFFIQFCIARALFSNFVRLIWPHAGSMMAAIFRSLLRLGRPASLHAAALAHMPPSSRATSYYNAILQVFMFGCAFAVVAPIILPCCWLFFLTGFFCYRYSILYLYERSYESGGRMWPLLCRQVLGVLLLMEVFSGAVLLVNQAWVLAAVMWTTLTPVLVVFWRYCDRHYLQPLSCPPLSVVAAEPRGVRLSPLVYMPPALRPGAIGWYPEQGKVWEKYGIPKHW